MKGDMLLVPQATDLMVPDALTACWRPRLPRTGEPAPVRPAPAAPKLVNLAADLPAMTQKAKAASASLRDSRRRHAVVPAPLSAGVKGEACIASVHKNDGEFMLVLRRGRRSLPAARW
jgi:hypothetical protein